MRVVDCSRVLAGPLAAMVLSDLGADVLKIERPGVGDDTRRWGPPFLPDGTAVYSTAVNRNRRSLTLELGDPDATAVLQTLVSHADVVVENFLPRHLASLGLDRLRADRGGAVWVSVRGAGTDGPSGDQPGYDVMVQARSGLMSITGHPETGPAKVGVAIADVVTGLYAAIGALAGLVQRGRVGSDGPVVEVPLLESAISALVNQASATLVTGEVSGPMGTEHPAITPYGPFPCADAELVIGAGNDRQYAALCAAISRPDLAADPRFTTNAVRVQHRAELRAELSATLGDDTAAAWQARLEAAGVPCAPVNTVDRALADPHVRAVGLVEVVESPAGPIPLVRSPLRVDGVRPSARRPPPQLGADTDAVLAGLGLDAATVAQLRASGAC